MIARAIKKQKQHANKDKSETRKNVGGGGATEDFRGDHLIFGRTKEGIAENFGRIQMGDHSNLFGK